MPTQTHPTPEPRLRVLAALIDVWDLGGAPGIEGAFTAYCQGLSGPRGGRLTPAGLAAVAECLRFFAEERTSTGREAIAALADILTADAAARADA
jgi:hypothetical protein